MKAIVDQIDDDNARYRLAFSIDVNVDGDVDIFGEHVYFLRGKVLGDDPKGKTIEIGELNLYWMQLDTLLEYGVPAPEVFKSVNRTTQAYGKALYAKGSDDFYKRITEEFDIDFVERVLIIDSLSIDPQYRGRDLGLSIIRRTLQLFGNCATFALMKPFPLQFSGCRQPDWQRPEGVQDIEKEFRRGVAKLSRHWARLGFGRIRRSEYFGLNMNRVIKIRPKRPSKVAKMRISQP